MPKRLIALLVAIAAAALISLSFANAEEATPSTRDDHKALQGKWERPLTSGDPDAHGASRAVKEIAGAREKVTYYSDAGEAVYATTADFSLRQSRPVKLYEYSDF